MSNYLIKGETLTNIANAIRTKTGKTDSIATENMATEISDLPIYPLYDGAYEVNKSGYTVTITGTTDSGGTDGINYSTDNGLSGFAKCGETVVLEGVTSITLSNWTAPMGGIYINDDERITTPYEPITVAITQDTSIYVQCIYAS